MGMLATWLGGREAEEDMARAKARPLDITKIDLLVLQLKQNVGNADAFRSITAAISKDKDLSAAEAIEIAHKFAGGIKPKSKKAALTAIGQERLRQSHAKAKGETAAKTRLW